MAGMGHKSQTRRQTLTFELGLGLGLAAAVTWPCAAQSITVAAGQNLAQQSMGQSITRFCPTISMIAATPGQMDLAQLCTAMVTNAFGLDQGGLNAGLQSLNGGAELLVPVNQASVLQATQTSRQTGVVEARLSRDRE